MRPQWGRHRLWPLHKGGEGYGPVQSFLSRRRHSCAPRTIIFTEGVLRLSAIFEQFRLPAFLCKSVSSAATNFVRNIRPLALRIFSHSPAACATLGPAPRSVSLSSCSPSTVMQLNVAINDFAQRTSPPPASLSRASVNEETNALLWPCWVIISLSLSRMSWPHAEQFWGAVDAGMLRRRASGISVVIIAREQTIKGAGRDERFRSRGSFSDSPPPDWERNTDYSGRHQTTTAARAAPRQRSHLFSSRSARIAMPRRDPPTNKRCPELRRYPPEPDRARRSAPHAPAARKDQRAEPCTRFLLNRSSSPAGDAGGLENRPKD